MFRKVPAMLLTAALLTGSVAATAAFAQTATVQQQKITVNVNDRELVFPQDVVTENGVAYVNASTLALALGGKSKWDNVNKSVKISNEADTYALRMFENSTFAYKNGKEVRVPYAPRTTTGAVLVPLVFIAEELGAEVTYDEAALTYNLTIKLEK